MVIHVHSLYIHKLFLYMLINYSTYLYRQTEDTCCMHPYIKSNMCVHVYIYIYIYMKICAHEYPIQMNWLVNGVRDIP